MVDFSWNLADILDLMNMYSVHGLEIESFDIVVFKQKKEKKNPKSASLSMPEC